MHYAKEIIIALLILTVFGTTFYWQEQINLRKQTITTLQEQIKQQQQIQQPTKEMPTQLPVQTTEQTPKIETIKQKEQPTFKTADMPVLAYNRQTQKGVVGYVEVTLLPGKGDILIDVRPFNSPAVQHSAESAVLAALKEAGKRQLTYQDIKIKFYIDTAAVGGESAGIAISLAALSLLTEQKLKNYVAATGTIDRDGNIGKVGGILQKAEAASKKNKRLLLIPRGEGEVIATTPQYYVDETGKIVGKGPQVQRPINVMHEARTRWNVDVQQVATLAEARKYAFE